MLFPSLDRLVAFLRAYSDDGSLDELIPGLRIEQVRTPLRTREIQISLEADSSYRMDRVAAMAKLAGGMTFTGTQRHFVQYRDATSPLGYDVIDLEDGVGGDERMLYADSFQQRYTTERELPFRDLLLRLSPHRLPRVDLTRAAGAAWVSAEVGVGHALISYLFRWQVDARAALAEWPGESAFDDAPRRLFIFDVRDAPERIIALLRDLPGVTVYVPTGEGAAVEVGYQHPVALDSCGSVFEGGLTLFAGETNASAEPIVHALTPLPSFAPVRALVRASIQEGSPAGVAAPRALEPAPSTLALRLAPTSDPYRNVVAAAVPAAEREWLFRMLYVLPPKTLQALRVTLTDEYVYLLDPSGIEGVPLGRFFSEVAPKIYAPSGTDLVPAIAPAVLQELIVDQGDAHVFFHPNGAGGVAPIRVPGAAFAPVSRAMIDEIVGRPVHADAPARFDPEMPRFHYDEVRALPFRGVPKPPAEMEVDPPSAARGTSGDHGDGGDPRGAP